MNEWINEQGIPRTAHPPSKKHYHKYLRWYMDYKLLTAPAFTLLIQCYAFFAFLLFDSRLNQLGFFSELDSVRWAKPELGREIGDFLLLILYFKYFSSFVYTFSESLRYVYNIYENSW